MTQAFDSKAVRVADPATSERETAEDTRPIGVIVNDLWEKAEALVRQEMRLGLTEAEEKVAVLKEELGGQVSELKTELIVKAIGGAVVFAGLLTLVAAITLLVAEAVDPWIAALLVGAVTCGVGVALLKRELKQQPTPSPRELVPERTIHSVKQDVRTIQEATHDSAR